MHVLLLHTYLHTALKTALLLQDKTCHILVIRTINFQPSNQLNRLTGYTILHINLHIITKNIMECLAADSDFVNKQFANYKQLYIKGYLATITRTKTIMCTRIINQVSLFRTSRKYFDRQLFFTLVSFIREYANYT